MAQQSRRVFTDSFVNLGSTGVAEIVKLFGEALKTLVLNTGRKTQWNPLLESKNPKYEHMSV